MRCTVTRVYKSGRGQRIGNTEHTTEYTTEQNAVLDYESELWKAAIRGETDLILLTLNYGCEVKRGTYFGLAG